MSYYRGKGIKCRLLVCVCALSACNTSGVEERRGGGGALSALAGRAAQNMSGAASARPPEHMEAGIPTFSPLQRRLVASLSEAPPCSWQTRLVFSFPSRSSTCFISSFFFFGATSGLICWRPRHTIWCSGLAEVSRALMPEAVSPAGAACLPPVVAVITCLEGGGTRRARCDRCVSHLTSFSVLTPWLTAVIRACT